MRKPEYTKGGFPFHLVMERLKRAAGLSSDGDVARALGMSPNAFSNRKHGNSLPYDQLVQYAISQGLNLNALFTGKGPLKEDGDAPTPANVEGVDGAILALIFLELEKADPLSWDASEQERLQHAALHGGLAGAIYNETAFIKPEALQRATIRVTCESYATLRKVERNLKQVVSASLE
jgi:transcriptional regulator with XRE-family HTH domain